MECHSCNKILSNKYKLAEHHKNSKTCGTEERFKCELCSKLLSSKIRLHTHMAICKANTDRKEITNSRLVEYELKIESLERQLTEKTDQLTSMVEKQKTRKQLNLDPVIIREKIRTHLHIGDIQNGQKGVARFFVKNILKDESGNLLYRCVDISRNKFVYYDVAGNRCVDYRAQVLINCLVTSNFFHDMREISKKFYNIDNTDEFIQWYDLIDSVSDIRTFEKNKEFRRYITMLCCG